MTTRKLALLSFILAVELVSYASAQTDATQTTSTFSSVGVTISGDTSRQFVISAKDAVAAASVQADVFVVDLFSSSPSCSPTAATSSCAITCSPTSDPSCLSSSRPASSDPHWVTTAAYLGNGNAGDDQYSIEYEPEAVGDYDVSIYLATAGGLNAAYYDNIWYLDSPVIEQIDATIDLSWGSTDVLTTFGVDYVGIRWTGKIKLPTGAASGMYTFFVNADDGARLWIDRVLIVDAWATCCIESWGSVTLTTGHYHDIILEFKEITDEASITLEWSGVSVARQIVPATSLYSLAHIAGSPYATVTIGPGDPPDLTSTTCSGTALSSATAGTTETFTIIARDAHSNLQTSATGSAITLTFTPGGPTFPTPVTYVSGAEYTAYYLPTTSGVYSLDVNIDGVPLTTGPFSITVNPGTTDATLSTHTGDGAATAGTTESFTVQAIDGQGNNQNVGGDTVTAIATGPGAIIVVGAVAYTTAGAYSVNWTPTLSGAYSMDVQIGGVSIIGSPYAVTVAVGVLNAGVSEVVSSFTATSGITSTLIVQAKDAFANDLSAGGATLTATLISPVFAFTADSLVDNTDGTYTMTYTPTVKGTYTFQTLLDAVNVGSASVDVVVSPGVATIGDTVVSPPSTPQVDVTETFHIEARDVNSNLIDTDSHTYVATLTCPGPVDVVATIVWAGSGIYTATYTPTKNGACNWVITLDATPLTASPFAVTVSPGTAVASTTTAAGAGLTAATAGAAASFVVSTLDSQSNALSTGGSSLSISSTPSGITFTTVDNSDGTYQVSYTPTTAGSYLTAVLLTRAGGLYGSYYNNDDLTVLHSAQIDSEIDFQWSTGAPLAAYPSDYFSIQWIGQIKPAITDTYRFSTTLASLCGVYLAIGSTVVINSWDATNGNIGPYGDISLVANTMYDVDLRFNENIGSAAIRLYWQSSSISKQIVPSSVLYSSVNIVSSPFALTVSPGATTYATSTASGTGLSAATTGVVSSFTIQAKDAYGNDQTVGAEEGDFSVAITPAATGTITDNALADGTYSVDYTPTVPGSQLISVKHSGSHIVGSPFSITIAIGAASSATSVATGTGIAASGLSGETLAVSLQCKDSNSNNRPSTDDVVVITTSVLPGPVVTSQTITAEGSGLYSTSFTIGNSGNADVNVKVGGVDVTGSPFTITIQPGVGSAADTIIDGAHTLVTVSDANPNAATSGGEEFWVRLYDHNGVYVRGSVTDNTDGTYTLAFTPTHVGEWTMTVQMMTRAVTGDGDGLTGNYYSNRWFSGTPDLTRVDPTINFDWGTDLITSSASDYVSIRWTGFIKPLYAETYNFYVNVDEGVRLYIDDILIIEQWDTGAGSRSGFFVVSDANYLYSIRLEFKENTGTASCVMSWDSPTQALEVVPQSKLFSAGTDIAGTPLTHTHV